VCVVPLESLRRLLARFSDPERRRSALAAVALAGIGLFAIVATLLVATSPATPSGADTAAAPSFTYSRTWSLLELQAHVQAGEVIAISVPADTTATDTLVAKTADGQLVRVSLAVGVPQAVAALQGFGYGNLLTNEALTAARPATAAPAGGAADVFRTIVSWLIPAVLIGLLVVLLMRGMSRGGLPGEGRTSVRTIVPGRRKGRPDSTDFTTSTAPTVRLDDVAGVDEAKLELTETIEFLKNPEKFHSLGARIPRGIMLYGPPGTGKTMLARAVAAEAGVPFHYASGSDFVEKYVGVGARRIRDLFAKARKMGRGVIFFDEFDALGKARGGQNSHEEREQTLNQLLVELDGFSTTDDVIVIAATNRLDILDSAILRPGRFNRKIHVGLPDVVGRGEILRVHARNKPLAASADLEALARKTYGFSGAQLADLLNEAAILTARRGGSEITPEDLHQGWLKVAVGTSRHRSMDERERSIIAAHEVGHAICGKVFGDKRRVEEISLFAHGEALGVTVSSQEDNDLPSESDLRARLVALMGGRAAEELLFHEVTGGASNDFDKANQIATTMVTKWGMGRDPEAREDGTSGRGALSFLVARQNGSLPSEVQPAATRAIRHILDEAYAQALSTLIDNMPTLRRIAAYLVEHERVDGDTFDALFEGSHEVPNADGEWRPATARPRAWGEIAAFLDRRTKPAIPVAADAAPPVVVQIPASAPAAPHVTPVPALPAPAPLPSLPPGRAAATPRRARGRGILAGLRGGPRRPAPAPTAATAGSRTTKRLRNLAAGYLRMAEEWVTGSEAEADR
jgi:cell division protease FtsH